MDMAVARVFAIWRRSTFSRSISSQTLTHSSTRRIPPRTARKLRVIFPLVLGAITADTLSTQRELKDLERDHERLRRELDARLAAARAWEAEVESYYLQARGLGLLPDSEAPAAGWPLDKYILELRKVPALVQAMDIPDVREGTNEAAAVEFSRVADEEDQLAQETGLIRRRLG